MRVRLVLAVFLLFATGAASAQEMIASHLGNQGPAFKPGVKPSTLGWGADGKPYPDKFVVNPIDGAEMAWIPPGEFTMGSSKEEGDYAYEWAKKAMGDAVKREWYNDETPAHKVRITQGFWMYRHEVTNAQYRKLKEPPKLDYQGLTLTGDRQPVAGVTWDQCKAYCEWAGGKLPTEAQWEYACRAGTTTRFWWGDSETEAGRYANVADRTAKAKLEFKFIFDTDDGQAVSAPVGNYAANRFGLYDMIGNVWEWCNDWYDEGYYAKSPSEDPAGPAIGALRVVRGGSWDYRPFDARSAFRNKDRPDEEFGNFGFRPVVSSE